MCAQGNYTSELGARFPQLSPALRDAPVGDDGSELGSSSEPQEAEARPGIAERGPQQERPTVALRIFECACALGFLVASLPITLLIALLIKIDSPGPALFRQARLGKNARLFPFVKFRTMYVDARERFPELYAYSYDDDEIRTIMFKVVDDPRRTRIGRLLRKSSLDELPNFWNVLTGDMALVGPRPEIPEMLPYYQGEDLLKFTVRPGVTGLAQVSGRGNLTFRETVDLDVAYVKSRSFLGDVDVLLRTVKMVLVSHGAF